MQTRIVTRPPHLPSFWHLYAFITSILLPMPCMGWQVVVPTDYNSIPDALAAVAGTTGATVILEPGTYQGAIAIPDGVVLKGRETARTFLQSTSTEPAITANGTQGSRVSNLTFTSATGKPALWVNAGSNLIISNNVFALGSNDTAILVEAASPSIKHNVFFGNGTALNTGGNVFTIQNNAFVDNTASLAPTPIDQSAISSNGFFVSNGTATTYGANPVTGAPQFVAPGTFDFHLQASSPYINAGAGVIDVLDGTGADIGAYGGEFAEGIPFPVGMPEIVSTTNTSINLRWPANLWYRLGGYNLYYDSDGSGPPYSGNNAAGGPSPIDVGNITTYTLDGLTFPAPPAAPTLALAEPLNGALKLNWSAVPSATGYQIHYGVASPNENSVDVGNVTGHTLTGLQNGTTYRITVSAYTTARYFLAVTAYAAFGARPQSALSQEVSTTTGAPVSGPSSNEIRDFPEAVVSFPDLPDTNGCFIATAAYGHYSAEEVQLLRTFRNRYLLTNAPGRSFVAWYYRHSPEWVKTLEEQSWAKPAVRLALLPVIGIAGFTLNTPTYVKWLVVVVLFMLLSLRRYRLRQCIA